MIGISNDITLVTRIDWRQGVSELLTWNENTAYRLNVIAGPNYACKTKLVRYGKCVPLSVVKSQLSNTLEIGHFRDKCYISRLFSREAISGKEPDWWYSLNHTVLLWTFWHGAEPIRLTYAGDHDIADAIQEDKGKFRNLQRYKTQFSVTFAQWDHCGGKS